MEYAFDSTGIQPLGVSEPIPLGTYDVMITGSGKSDTNAGDGSYLGIDVKITEGPLKGRVQTDRLNLWNSDQKTVELAQRRLASYSIATGVTKFRNTEEMHGKPFKARIGPQVDRKTKVVSDQYSEVKGVFYADGSELKGSGGTPAPGAAAPVFMPAGAPAPAVAAAPAPPAPPAAPAPPAPPAFPPAGWVAHPTAPGYFYKDNDVLTEAELRAKSTPPAAPAAPPAPPAAPAAPAAGSAAPPWAQ